MKKSLLFLFLFSVRMLPAQPTADSCSLQISLLTCTPGEELYSTFGHSAIRVADSSNGTDIIFNYGTFDFYDPAFYQKFIKGKLLYFVSVNELHEFLAEYEYYKRGVTEQVLQLACGEKQQFLAALYENAKEENKYYRYDFNYDNCTTRLRDMLEKITGKPLQTTNILPSVNTTFRHLIHDYLHKGRQYWSKLGIDILLGSPLDKKINNREAMFLPDFLMMAFDSAVHNNQPLVSTKKEMLPAAATANKKPLFTPFVVFSLLLLVIAGLSFYKSTKTSVFFKVFDFTFFLLCGLLGVLLLFMWFGTEHAMCKNNFNLLWAMPLHLIVAPFLFTQKKWVGHYFRFTVFYTVALFLSWFLLPQQMNAALLPVLGIIGVRSLMISKRKQFD